MPFYEYQCKNKNCAAVTTTLRRMDDRHAPLPCPKCNANTVLLLSVFSTPKSDSASMPPFRGNVNPRNANNNRTSGVTLKNVHIEGANIGISLPQGANVDMQGVTFNNVKTPVEIREDE
jgi:putative FmdB family regulatory protein